MRLPLVKLHRAFPELDRFTDRECGGMIHRVVWNRPVLMILASVAALAAWFVVVAPMSLATVLLSRTQHFVRYDIELVAVGLLVNIGLGTLAALLVRDAFIRMMVREWVSSTRCLRCRYSLLGLHANGDEVQCPECGCSNNIAARGLDPSTLSPKGSA